MSSLKKKLSIIASFSKSYHDDTLKKQKAAAKISSWNNVLNDWWLALRFFFDRAFYQGRRDKLSWKFEQATLKALKEVFGRSASSRKRMLWQLYDTQSLGKANWNNKHSPLRKSFEKQYDVQGRPSKTGKKGDNIMVTDVLNFVCEKASSKSQPLNLVRYMKEGIQNCKIARVAKELDGIYQVGPKIYSLLLRDVVDLFSLSRHLSLGDFKYLQAVDTWVEQLAIKLGFHGSKTKLAIDLAEACQKHAVNPIAFNQGAWYLAAHSFDVLTENIERIKPPK